MPIGNYEELTSISINSASNQTLPYSNFIFIIDTKTEHEANKVKNKLKNVDRSKIIRTNRVGQGKARQIGVDNATSEFLAFLDYDDIWHPKKIEIQIRNLKKEGSDFSFCSYRAINIEKKKILFNVHCNRKISLINFFISCPIGLSTVLCRREIFEKRMKFSYARKRSDYITWFNLWKNLNPKHSVCNDYLALIVKRSSSISSDYWRSTAGYISMKQAFRLVGFNSLNSYFIAFFYSLIQIPVKLKRLIFKYFFKSSNSVIDLDISYYLNN